MRRHRYLLASSPVVAKSLRRDARHAFVATAPLALDPTLYPRAPLDAEPVAGIIGTASWAPTCESMVRLIEDVWPRVRAQLPRAQLLVAGRGTDRLPRADGVAILGEVESAIEFLHRLSVLVFPLARGSGMKIKALEAIACGIPVVTTRAGAEGLSGGRGVFVSEDDAVLAREVVRLLESPAEVQATGAAAREAFLAHHTPDPAVEPLLALYERMAQ